MPWPKEQCCTVYKDGIQWADCLGVSALWWLFEAYKYLIIWPHPLRFWMYFEYVIFKSIFLYSPLFCELPVPRNLCFRYTEVIFLSHSLSLSLSLSLFLSLGHVIWSSTSGLRPWEQFLMESIEFGFRYLELLKKYILRF